MAVFLRPGRQLKTFRLYRADTVLDGKGRPSDQHQPDSDAQDAVAFRATIAQATQQEMDRWDRISHPITHILVQTGTSKAGEGDTLVMPGAPGRFFHIQGRTDPGELGFNTIYYVQERKGVD